MNPAISNVLVEARHADLHRSASSRSHAARPNGNLAGRFQLHGAETPRPSLIRRLVARAAV